MYFVPLIFTFLLTVGGVGIFVAKIPAEKIQFGVLQTLVVFAQSMSMHDDIDKKKNNPTKNKRVDELIKLEGRRRKNEWKDIHEQYVWSWRHMEETGDYKVDYGRYFIVQPKMVWRYDLEPTGETIQYDNNFYIKTQPHHWIVYIAFLAGLLSFLHGFFTEITKAGY
ncbi:TMhelix containing protein [Vibrio phage 2.275.O._10N.286.54.E11]|nr:TMhelix containing protein [Vibrio phage 2.275.O._10N.286.54.E11]